MGTESSKKKTMAETIEAAKEQIIASEKAMNGLTQVTFVNPENQTQRCRIERIPEDYKIRIDPKEYRRTPDGFRIFILPPISVAVR
jgi:hypothetical protein